MANLRKIVYLSEAQKDELFAQGSITSNNRTITYNENDIYVTPDKSIDSIQLNGTTYTSNNGTVNLGTALVDDSDYVINSLIAPAEDTSTASQLYSIGDLFIYNKQLYRATSAIAASTAITPNTNCEALQLIEYIGEKANVNNPVFTNSISLGRKASTTVGTFSVAEGTSVTASGYGSHAEGAGTVASGGFSHVEGSGTAASGIDAHAEGGGTRALGDESHAEGAATVASGRASHAQGSETIATGAYSHVGGKYNVEDSYSNWAEWTANTSYAVGDKVKVTSGSGSSQTINGYICKTANSDSSFTSSKWTAQNGQMNYAEIIGNGTSSGLSNARALDWEGNEHLMGDLYVGCNTDSTGGTKVAKVTDIPDENTIYIKSGSITNPTTVNSNASTVINAAIVEANTNGKHYVVIPGGEYWLTATIYLKSNVILKGCGMDATILKIADGYDIDAIRTAEPVNNSGIMDLAIDGNRIQNYSTFASGHHGNAINVWLHYGIIERVRTNWIFKHSLLLNYDTGTSDDGLGFTQEHQNDVGNLNKVLWCDFQDSLLQGIMWGWRTMDSWMCYTNIGSHAANLYLEGGTSRFIGNHFDGDGDNGIGPEYNVYCGDGCKAMLFDSNIFENTQKQNIFFRQPSYSNQTMTITFTNNIIRTCSKTSNEQYANIYISGYSASVPATEVIISNNQILNPDTNANHGYAGIHLAYCENSKICGNTFFNVGSNRVVLDNCSDIFNDSAIISLPPVTSSDNGKILMVVNGVWTATTLPSASGVSF